MLAALVWLIALEAVGLLALPLAVRVFRPLGDRGYGLAKPLGLLVVGYLTWLLAMLGLLHSTAATVLVLAALLALGLWVWNGRETVAWVRAQRGLVLASEAVFLVVYAAATLVRAFGPAINGQEKFMDMAIYHAFLRSEQLPAEDPWLSGFGMAYYYLGYFLWSLVAKATEVPPAVGYNLALAGTLALLAAGVFGLAYSLVLAQLNPESRAASSQRSQAHSSLTARYSRIAIALGMIAALATAVMGNLQAAVEVAARHGFGTLAFWRSVGVKNLAPPGPGLFPEGGWWFNAARVIPNIEPDGITEFPWFSLLLGDLHPHYVALPFDLLAVGLAVVAFRQLLAGVEPGALDVGVAALGLGVLIPLNTWDVGTFWIVYALAVVAALLLARGAPGRSEPSERPRGREVSGERDGARAEPPALLWLGPTLRYAAGLLAATFGLALLLYLPYFLGYQSQPLGLGVVPERTMFGSLLVLFGPFLVLTLGTVVRGWLDGLGDPDIGPLLRRYAWVAALTALLLAALAVRDATLAVLLGLLLATAPLLLAAWRHPTASPLAPAGLLLLVCALGLLLGTELLFIRDTFGSRMNTVFKFHYHVWLLLGLLSPLLALYLVRGPNPVTFYPRREGGAGRRYPPPPSLRRTAARGLGLSVVALATVLGLAGLLYPLGASWTKLDAFRGPATLDGAAWLERTRPGDAQAIRWLTEQVPGRPIIVEAVGDDYTEYARVSTFAGLPTLIGWVGHELQWRGSQPEFARRQQAVEGVYRTTDPADLINQLQRLRAEYVYVGRLEVDKYGLGVVDRFEGRLDPVYRAGDVTIYRVPRPPSGVGVGLAEVRP